MSISQDEAQKILDGLHGGNNASYALRFAAGSPHVMMVLSGLGSVEMMRDNLASKKDLSPLNEKRGRRSKRW